MPQSLYSVEEVATLLGLHVKSIRRYVRDGKLKAVRIGKQYRIARRDLETLTGQPSPAYNPAHIRRCRHIEASSIIDIDAISKDDAYRFTTYLTAGAKGRSPDDEPLRIDTIYDEERARLKVIISGSAGSTATLLRAIEMLSAN